MRGLAYVNPFLILKKSYWKAAHKFWYFNDKNKVWVKVLCYTDYRKYVILKDISWNAENITMFY